MNRQSFWAITILGGAIYGFLLYEVDRTSWPLVFGCFGLLFGLYMLQLYGLRLGLNPMHREPQTPITTIELMVAGVFLRTIALFALPELSDDYFRFIWDGRLWNHGVNPFAALPREHMSDPNQAAQLGLTQELYEGLNSPKFYTIYPPVLQFIFWLGTAIFPESIYGSVLVMKSFIYLAEIGSMALMLRILTRLGYSPLYLSLYALNPLVVIELTGNLHFEAIMIFFLLGSVWWLHVSPQPRWLISAIMFALAVAAKLLPLMLLPLLIRRLGFWRAVAYGGVVAILTGLLFLPIFDMATLINLSESIDLYFHRFEFNGSIYYVIRWIGYLIYDRNIIKWVGSWLALAAVIGILMYAWREKGPQWSNLPNGMLWVFTIYFAFATIVHPWYATTLVALAPFTRWRWPIVWTGLLPLSYFTYRSLDYQEETSLTFVIYAGALLWALWEVWHMRNHSKGDLT